MEPSAFPLELRLTIHRTLERSPQDALQRGGNVTTSRDKTSVTPPTNDQTLEEGRVDALLVHDDGPVAALLRW